MRTKSLLLYVMVAALFGAFTPSSTHADEEPVTDELPATSGSLGDLYELRVHMGFPVRNLNSWKPDVTARINPGQYFFAEHSYPAIRKRLGGTTYVASGLLRAQKGGNLTLDYTFMTVGEIGGIRAIYRSIKAKDIVLGKPYESWGGSGIATGFVFVISKVIKPAETPDNAEASVHPSER